MVAFVRITPKIPTAFLFFFCKILRILIPDKSLTKEVSIGDKSRKELPVNCNELLTKSSNELERMQFFLSFS